MPAMDAQVGDLVRLTEDVTRRRYPLRKGRVFRVTEVGTLRANAERQILYVTPLVREENESRTNYRLWRSRFEDL